MTRVVVKIGSSSLTDARGGVVEAAIDKLCDEIAALRVLGHEVVAVSSGAIAAGVSVLGLDERPTDVVTLQALAAAGQPRLLESYRRRLGHHGLVAAQALLDPHDFVDRRQYLHARRTLDRLLQLGCVPVVNENDTIARDELRYGDNDRLAALVAHSLAADVLVLLTDIDGLYTADPAKDPSATRIEHVAADDPLLAIDAGRSAGDRGSGGMASKLEAARIASWSGVRTTIADAAREGVLVDAVAGVAVGTAFAATHTRRLPARKLWIAFAAHVAGTVMVDDGARRAVVERATSLLPAGVVSAQGRFHAGETIEICAADGKPFARGMVSLDAAQLSRIAGMQTRDLPDGLVHEVVHRDDLVLLP
ncbi:MAG: glutamate 5-kinase [Ilumatobacteraceae bacterium]